MNYILDGLRQALVLLAHGDPETFSAVWTTLVVTFEAMLATLALGAPAGFLLGYREFPGKRAVRLVVETFLSFPTVVIGLVVYAFISRRGPLGDWELLFTVPGMAVGLTILGLPIVIALTAQAVESLDPRLRPTLLTLGAKSRHLFLATLTEARFGMLLATTAAFGRIVSEIGISMMLGGNIRWDTRTITTAIALETGKGEFATGIALGMVLMVIAFAVNLIAAACRRRAG
ncbi:binding-protein-dependent transport systems inner membrane component [Solidesulfovibrio fructosivorans JJ]]|uniref:Binding-protein-dependent transport systems inner membrane component n=1 Tax=Solidesulfovibrio fructosivorans JJ] TaxID=596151 RepID=E1JVX6_SOLFR|nr:ABC transporter permease [Solidesulfovibrio fructosivorans]EFL51614.1 binding-protein-dependent transport systems inner membrane component [Solidesulfovibrio fructosivorans JJ]]